MKEEAPAFQFYAADYLADAEVQMMTIVQEGIYIRLLAYSWREKDLPDDDEALSKLAKNAPIEDVRVVKQRFTPNPKNPGRLIHLRHEESREKQKKWREKSSEGGKKSAEVRAKNKKYRQKKRVKGASEIVEPDSNSSSSSSSSSSKKEKYIKGQKLQELFDNTRKTYPGTKKGLVTEFANFIKKHKDWRDILPMLEEKIKNQITIKEKLKSEGKFVPEWKNFGTWINQRCWEEEIGEGINVQKSGEQQKEVYSGNIFKK